MNRKNVNFKSDDFYVKYGKGGQGIDATYWDNYTKTKKAYSKLQLTNSVTWKELWYSPLENNDDGELDVLVLDEEKRIIDFGFGTILVPMANFSD